MNAVGAGSESKAGDALAGPPVLRRRIERNDLEFGYRVLGEREVAEISGPLGGAANDRAIELKFIAGALASIHRGVQHAGRTAIRHSTARHAGSERHKVPWIPLFSHADQRKVENLLTRNDGPA